MSRKPPASVIPIRPAAGSIPPDSPPPARSAPAAPPVARQGTARERRSNRMLPPIGGGNRAAMEAIEKSEISLQIRFLAQTQESIRHRFLRGVSEYEITRSLGGRSANVCRVDVEAVIRAGYRDERAARLEAERLLRTKAA